MAAACAAAAMLVAGAGPAAAQHPGKNGALAYTQGFWHIEAPCASADNHWLLNLGDWGNMAFSPSGRYLALNAATMEPNGAFNAVELFVVDVDRCLTPRPIGQASGGTSWSPDGRELAVVRDDQVQVISPQTGEVIRTLTPGDEQSWDASWSRDGKTIAYATIEGIRTVPARGGESKLVVPGGRAPDYSPDGKRLGYVKDGYVWSVDARSGRDARRTWFRASDFTYSPDGKQYLLSGMTGDCVTADARTGRILWRANLPQTDYDPCSAVAWQPR